MQFRNARKAHVNLKVRFRRLVPKLRYWRHGVTLLAAMNKIAKSGTRGRAEGVRGRAPVGLLRFYFTS
jgi:GTP-dependent phosphoenolpyruvate carboxykinase